MPDKPDQPRQPSEQRTNAARDAKTSWQPTPRADAQRPPEPKHTAKSCERTGATLVAPYLSQHDLHTKCHQVVELAHDADNPLNDCEELRYLCCLPPTLPDNRSATRCRRLPLGTSRTRGAGCNTTEPSRTID